MGAKLALSTGFVLAFAALAAVFSGRDGAHSDVLIALAVGCGVSLLGVWTVATSKR